MKKAVVIISGFILVWLVYSFQTPPQNPPKTITIELSVPDAIMLIKVTRQSEIVSAKFANELEDKINAAYADAVKKDSIENAKTKVIPKKP